MNKPVRVILLDEADLAYKKLKEIVEQQIKDNENNTDEMQLVKSIKQKIELIKVNPFYGNNMQKNLIPQEYIKKYSADNLWRAELTNYWRMLYTIKGDQIEIICFILDIVNHDKYNKILGYKKR